MPCHNPIRGYRAKHLNDNGKRPIVFKAEFSDGSDPIELPCGRCTGCRLEYSRQWALRCHHEAQMHDDNAFITLTYNNENLPEDQSIHKDELQKFFKRLRKNSGVKLRYFACGEYGEKNNRPHYHAIIFGFGFPDKYLYSKTKRGDLLFRSPLLEKCWTFGHTLIGNVTFESSAYVARYVMKKRKGKPDQVDKHGKTNEEYYKLLDKDTGEIHQLEPEFCVMSRRPGIGKTWFDNYRGDLNKDYITLRGAKHKLPKYYDSLLEADDPIDMMERKLNRMNFVDPLDNTMERLRTKEIVQLAKIQTLTRDIEKNL